MTLKEWIRRKTKQPTSLRGLRPKTTAYNQMFGEGSAPLDREGSCWKTLCLVTALCTMPQKQENPELAVRKFL